jgi:hypothetical protein
MINRILIGCALALVSTSAWADVRIRNGSGYQITEVYVSPVDAAKWGPDLLKDKMLAPNDTLTVTGVTPGSWDFRLVFREVGGKESWPCVIESVKLDSKGDDSTFDDDTLDRCAEHTDEGGADDEGEES